MIELKNVCFGYPNKAVFRRVSLRMSGHDISFVLGLNGSGKSTLFKLIMGRISPTSGEILLNGNSVAKMNPKEIARNIAYLPQTRNIADIAVYDFVLHGRFPYLGYPRIYGNNDRRCVEKSLEELGILDLRNNKLKNLSGGERQKVYLAMILTQDTEIVLLDEPDVFLDIRAKHELYHIIKQLKQKGKSIFMITHDLYSTMRYADKIYFTENEGIQTFNSGKAFENSDVYKAMQNGLNL
ncbi:MAG: ABC transporter ATP-binding protein [Clostridiales bacterium]|jgi:iron complex transport system ATP-binding protein|nr:ABC transporter ATP-binding protein [Clostridiales bacterium]